MPSSTSIEAVRLGLIGCGYVSKYHLDAAQRLGVRFHAVCDNKLEAAEKVAAATGARAFTSATELMDSGLVDAVIVATPHFAHTPNVLAAFERGLHVFVEKPLTVTVGEAQRLIDAHAKNPRLAFAVDFNQRVWPLWKHVRQMLDDGTIGRVARWQWTITDWFRNQFYFNESTWRGTWTGEGGGVLVNQCPHQLDLLCWFFGLPTRVMAVTPLGKHHRVEIEDEVHAILEYKTGTVGNFITSTGEAHGRNELEIVGDRATLRVRRGKIELARNATPVSEHIQKQKDRKTLPEKTVETIEHPRHDEEYVDMLRDFLTCAVNGGTPVVSGPDAARSVTLANAILLSGLHRRIVELPIDAAEVDALLKELQTPLA